MTLLLEVIGVLAVAALVRGALNGPASLIPVLSVVAVVVGGFAFWSNVWPEGHALVSEHTADARYTPEEALAGPGLPFGADEQALSWADSVLPLRARVFLECPQPAPCSNSLANWITYRLQPRVFTSYPSQARWIFFYDTPPTALPAVRFTGAVQFVPGMVIGRLVR